MIDCPWAQNGCLSMATTVHNVTRNIHISNSPFVSLLNSVKTEVVIQDLVLKSQVVHPLATWSKHAPIGVKRR